MEDLNSARPIERSDDTHSLRAEWLELAAGKPSRNPDGPGKDVADRLDKELRQFANQKQDNPSEKMVAFQGLVNKFEDAPDKAAAIKDFGPASAKLRVSMENEAIETSQKMEAEAAKDPGRKALQTDYEGKLTKFFDQVQNLPSKENMRVMDLVQVKPGESLETRDERVREGIANRPVLLKSFNNMEDAFNKIEAAKTPVEKQLAQEHKRDIDEAHIIRQVVNKASIRSQINA